MKSRLGRCKHNQHKRARSRHRGDERQNDACGRDKGRYICRVPAYFTEIPGTPDGAQDRTAPAFLNADAWTIIEQKMTGRTAFLFPSPKDPGRPLSSNLPLWYAIRKEAGSRTFASTI